MPVYRDSPGPDTTVQPAKIEQESEGLKSAVQAFQFMLVKLLSVHML